MFVTEHPWNKARDGVDKHNRRNRAIREHIVADGNLKIDKVFDNTVINSFVMAADYNHVFTLRKLCPERLG